MLITSRNNLLIKSRSKLEKPSVRRKEGLFIVGGSREIEKAVIGNFEFIEFFFCPELMNEQEKNLIETRLKVLVDENSDSITVHEVSDNVMDKLSPRKNSHGLVGIAKIVKPDFITLANSIIQKKDNPLFVVLELPEKPGNIGGVLRTSDGLGVDMLVLCEPVCDMYNSNIIRSSLGCYFTVPWAVCTTQDAVRFFKENNIKTFASTPMAESNIWDHDYTAGSALVMGSEKDGLTDYWLKNADQTMKIPMNGAADSLNLSQFSTLAIYEAIRQRKHG